jgi:hypothetical protein
VSKVLRKPPFESQKYWQVGNSVLFQNFRERNSLRMNKLGQLASLLCGKLQEKANLSMLKMF